MDNRAATPVVGKVLAAGIALLYIAATTTLLLGGVIPDYRTATADELADRVLADAAGTVERALPKTDSTASVRVRTRLPATIRDTDYTIRLDDGTLTLDHPTDELGAQTRIALPESVGVADGTWQSGGRFVVRIEGPATNRTLRLEEGRS